MTVPASSRRGYSEHGPEHRTDEMMKRTVQSLFLAGEAGKLEAMWERPAGHRTDLAGLVCHPHPLYGGTMHNKVVHHTSLALQTLGLPVLRFNFRGAAMSEGVHDEGRGEAGDVRSALRWLGSQWPGLHIILAGFSFGAWVGLRVACEADEVRGLVGVGIPADQSDMTFLDECAKPKLFVQGDNDPFGSVENVNALFGRLPPPKELCFVEDADHFFTGKLDELRSIIKKDLPPLLREAAEPGF